MRSWSCLTALRTRFGLCAFPDRPQSRMRLGRARSARLFGRARLTVRHGRVSATITALALLCVTAAFPRVASADLLNAARLPLSYRTWTVESDSVEVIVSQFHLPAVGSLALGENVDLVISTAYASSDLEPDGESSLSLASAAGVKGQLFVRLLGNRLMLQGGVNVPTGGTALDLDELSVVQALSSPLLGFRLKHYGEGFNVGGGAALALPLGESATFGLGGGFVQRGAYEFVEGDEDYQPGTEISGSTGLDFNRGGAPVLRLDATYRMFGEDELGDEAIFEEGDQLELQASASTVPAPFGASARVRSVIKDDNTVFSGEGENIESITLDAGRSVKIDATISYGLSEAARIGVAGEFLQFSGAADAAQDGHTFGVGPTLNLGLGSRARLGLEAMYLSGQTDDVDSFPGVDLSGFSIGFGLFLSPGF